MTAPATKAPAEDVAPIFVDLSDPKQYRQMTILGTLIAQHICAMPLEGIAKMADDAAKLALFQGVSGNALGDLRIDRDVLDVLRAAQKQLQKIRARSGG